MTERRDVPIDRVAVSCLTVPTEEPESDGTLEWDSTTVVVVEAWAGETKGTGYTYGAAATGRLIVDELAPVIMGHDALDVAGGFHAMVARLRNAGRPGLGSMAVAAVDTALWDLKARLLDVSLVRLLGRVRPEIAAYASGGFTSYSVDDIRRCTAEWAERGYRMGKIKVGRDPADDVMRVDAAHRAAPHLELFVDANGAYSVPQAVEMAARFAESGVTWFEEPVSSDDLAGLEAVRRRAPAGMAITAGEYGYDLPYFRRMLDAGAVDVLQPDATRCAGVTGFLGASTLCEARSMPLSAHTAPTLHTSLCCALAPAVHVEDFHDHARIEPLLFDGALRAEGGVIRPDATAPGLGIELKRADAERWLVWSAG